MCVASDTTLRRLIQEGEIGVEPLEDWQIQPSSIDLTLGKGIKSPTYGLSTILDPMRPRQHNMADIPFTAYHTELILPPGAFVLGHTAEEMWLNGNWMAEVEGKSSLGRLGLMIHITAGIIDPGWRGQITLEIVNINEKASIVLRPGMPIAQLKFVRMTEPVTRLYGADGLRSKYQNSAGVVESMGVS